MVKQRTDKNEGGNDTQDHHKEKLPCLGGLTTCDDMVVEDVAFFSNAFTK
ncbi:hypothetical protein BN132_249 [Cronobacter turicensis 564]|nr:hypothetical protein BN132_249 [Cronobacter turicensis 564]